MKKKAIPYAIVGFCSCLFFTACNNIEPNSITNELTTVTYASEGKIENDYIIAKNQPELLASYSTNFSDYVKGRNKNIKKAASAINGKVVKPGETFSFNDTVGPTTKNRGFSLAKIFDKGVEKKGYGGGVCQVSSTLYNAADKAGLEIVERHPHTKKVNYVPDDRDAATSYGKIDFKFKNNFAFPIIISSSVTEDTLTVNIDTM